MDQVVVSKVNEVFLRIDCDEGILRELSEYFTFLIPNAKYDPRVKKRLWDGKIRLVRKGGLLYLGLAHEVAEFCKVRGYEYVSKIPKPNRIYTYEEVEEFAKTLNLTDGEGQPLVPYDYQIQAVVDILNEGYRGIILSPTSSGKSLIIYILVMFFNKKSIIIVPTKLLVRQMTSDFKSYGYQGNISQIMSDSGTIVDKNALEQISVSTWQSIYKMPEKWFDQFNTIIGDEAHTFKANSLKYIMESSTKAFVKVGTSGTLDYEPLNIMTLKGLFGKIVKTVTTKELMDSGRATPIDITALRLVYKDEDKKYAARQKWEYPDEMAFLRNNEKRQAFIVKLAKKLEGNTLVLFRSIDHGKELHRLISEACPDKDVHLVYGKIKTDKRDKVRTNMEASKGVIGVCSYETFATGTNIKQLHNIIFGAPIKAEIKVLQAIGRALRKHATKQKAKLFDIGDDLTTKGYENFAYTHFTKRLGYYVKEQFKHRIVEVKI